MSRREINAHQSDGGSNSLCFRYFDGTESTSQKYLRLLATNKWRRSCKKKSSASDVKADL
jgi:hypothetical protein